VKFIRSSSSVQHFKQLRTVYKYEHCKSENETVNLTDQKELWIAAAFPLSWLTAFSAWLCEPAPRGRKM
jgi:hypothetical protein